MNEELQFRRVDSRKPHISIGVDLESGRCSVSRQFLGMDFEIDERFDDPSQANLGETIDEGLYEHSVWSRKKKYIETRPKNWLSRFTRDYAPMAPPIAPKVQAKEVQFKSAVLLEPERPILYKVEELKPFNDSTLQSNFCLVCWKMVIIGPTRIKCLHCPVVVHRYCVTNIADFFVPLDEQALPSPAHPPRSPPVKNTRTSDSPTNSSALAGEQLDTFDSQDQLGPPLTRSHLPTLKTTTAFRRDRTNQPRTRIPSSSSSSPASAARRGRRNNDDSLPQISSAASPSRIVDTRLDDSTRDVRWICPFCIHEVSLSLSSAAVPLTRLLLSSSGECWE
jgi:hypothetical protein